MLEVHLVGIPGTPGSLVAGHGDFHLASVVTVKGSVKLSYPLVLSW